MMQRLILSTALFLLIASIATGFSATPLSVKSIAQNVRTIYEQLETAHIYHDASPTIKFSFVPPQNTSTPALLDESDTTIFQQVSSHYGSDKPLAVYLPGLDGFGISATQQYDDLAQSFELWRMTVSTTDQSSFPQLVSTVVNFIESLAAADRPLTLIGESFGGLLAPAVALRLQKKSVNLEGLVLVNPATSYEETQWSAVGPFLASLKTSVPEIPNVPNAYSILGGMTLAALVPDRSQFRKFFFMLMGMDDVTQFGNVLDASTEGFALLDERLPAHVIQLRLAQWLPVGSAVVNARLQNLDVPTLVIVGDEDAMLPSKQEADRLVQVMPQAEKLVVRGAGHFVLDERVNLTEAILYSKWDPLQIQAQESSYDPILDWSLPPKHEIDRISEERVGPLRRLTSPVFFSTDQHGKRWKGLAKLPSEGPILFVANHQLLGLDLGMIVAELLQERGIAARGLAHPVIFQGSMPGAPTRRPRGIQSTNNGPFDNDTFQKFGAVKVTPRNYYRLLQTGQNVLLFPGGVREVFHGKDEAYQLFWPEKVDFVRTAARFNATVVPISAVGAADSLNVLVDAPDIANLPFGLGKRAMEASANVTAARFNVNDQDELFQPPVVVPASPARHYFMFGKPMSTANVHHKDKSACEVFYQDVQKELIRGFDDILRAREKDPYADPVRRLAYEQLTGKQAPTFSMSELQQ